MNGVRFRQKFTPEDAIGSHACSLEANERVTNDIPLGCPLLLPVHTVNCVQTLKDQATQLLYFVNNGTTAPSAGMQFEAVTTKVLLHYNGTQQNPVEDVSVRGITIRDTAYTYLDPHGAPSGGDWGLQRTGALTVKGTRNLVIDSSLFTRLDGLGIFITGFNRNLTIINSTFEWIGGTAMASWGDTGYALNANGTKTIPWPRGPDARDGNQPIGTKVLSNIVSDVGVWQKQSSFWFQATSAKTLLKGNVHFNGPRPVRALDRNLHSRMPLDPRPARFKRTCV
jgi:hypothetical protein